MNLSEFHNAHLWTIEVHTGQRTAFFLKESHIHLLLKRQTLGIFVLQRNSKYFESETMLLACDILEHF
jgi:hypothetical protein